MTPAVDQVQQLVQQALRDLEQLSASPAAPTVVLTQVLQTLCRVTASPAALAWIPGPDSTGRPTFHAIAGVGNPAAAAVTPAGSPIAPALQQLQRVTGSLKPAVVPPGSAEFAATPLAAATQVFAPMDTIGRPLGVIHLIAPAAVAREAHPQFAALVQHAARSAGKCLARRQAEILREDAVHAAAVLRAVEHLLPIDDPSEFIHELANTARRALGASRVAVVRTEGKAIEAAVSQLAATPTAPPPIMLGEPSALGATGAEPSDEAAPGEAPRGDGVSEAVMALAEALRGRSEAVSFAANRRVEDAALDAAGKRVMEAAGSQAVHATPLTGRGGEPLGWMVAEFAMAESAREKLALQQSLGRNAAVLLGRILAWRSRPLGRVGAMLGRLRRGGK